MKKTLLSMSLALAVFASASAQPCRVSFNLNYKTSESIGPVSVEAGRMLPLSAKPLPQREGYRFGGWYTSRKCLPQEEWRFGNNSSFFTPPTDSMKVEKSMVLYAKWVSPTPVRTAEELDAMREDLYGWYVLEADIDLSGIANWIPVGEYEADYEFAPGEWWRHAFKGVLDGNGHTIRGLNITELTTDKSGLFGTVANGEIRNLKMEGSHLAFTAERPYVAPLAGILKQDEGQVCSITGCQVLNTTIQVKTTNTAPVFHSFTGLAGGAWGGTIENCSVSGTMDLEMAGTGGGELYVGPYLGEAYNDTRSCTSDFDINIRFTTPAQGAFKAFIGGLQASATNVDSCTSRGRIRVSGEPGSGDIFVGGLVGSERYGTVQNSTSSVKMEVSNLTSAQTGGISGEFNGTYGMIGAASGIKTTVIQNCTFNGSMLFKDVAAPRQGEINGAGVPEPLSSPWGISMDYKIENCTAAPSADLSGTWYGLYYGSPVTVTFGDKVTIASEAFSSMNMACGYKLGNTRISLSDGPGGMAGEGIYTCADGILDLLLVFGAPGQIPVPASFADAAGNPAATRFSLTRDRTVIEQATAPVNAPAASALAFQRSQRLGAGINLNSLLDGNGGEAPLKKGRIRQIAKAGFKSVRLPIRWAAHASLEAPYTIAPEFFKKVDAVVDECLKNGLAVILDNHYYPGLSFNLGPQDLETDANIQRLKRFWEQISAHYKGYSDETLFFELMNEPSLALEPALWNRTVAELTGIIRRDNPGKTILVTTPSLGQHWTIGLLEFPDDWNIIVDAHYYLPQTFTHQGLSYALAGDMKDIPWSGTEADKAPLEMDFAFLSRWSGRNARPVCIGEYGVCANADETSRAAYLSFLRSLLDKYGFSSHYWAYHRDIFGIYDEASGKWNQPVLKSLNLK